MSLKNNILYDALSRFLKGRAYYPVCILIAALAIILDLELYGVVAFSFLLTLLFFTLKESARMFYPVVFLMICAMNIMSEEDIAHAGYLVLCAIPVFSAIFYNIIRHKKKLRSCKFVLPMIAVSLACTLGGLGSISVADYIAPSSLFYVFFLGFGMIGLVLVVYTLWDGENYKDLQFEFIQAMCHAGIFLSFVMVYYYAMNFTEFSGSHQIIEILSENPFRNLAVAFYLIAMPFAFFCARHHVAYILGGCMMYGACLISGSRMGLLFGSLEFILCMVYIMIKGKKFKMLKTLILLGLVAVVIFLREDILNIYFGREDFSWFKMGEIRVTMMHRSIDDFWNAPLFGQGLGYTGNEDSYKPLAFEMHWYHNFLCQIVGSLGIFGIICYCYQFYYRLCLILERPSSYGWLVFMMYIGVLMNSLVDPGIFMPFPTVFILNMAFMLLHLEHQGDERVALHPIKRLKGRVLFGK